MPEETETQGIISVLPSHKLSRWVAPIAGLMVLVTVTMLRADAQADYQQSLKEIAERINGISRNLNANKALLKSEQDRLASVEQSVLALRRQIRSTEQAIAEQEQAAQKLETGLTEARATHADDLQALTGLIRQQYKQGTPNYLQLLLNQQDPYAVGRLGNYYRYFAMAQQARLTEVQQAMVELDKLADDKQQALVELENQRQKQFRQRAELEQVQTQRQQSVERLNAKVTASSDQIKKLQQDRERLNTLLEQIAAQARELKRLEQQRLAEQQRQRDSGNATTAPVQRPLVAGGFLKQRGRLRFPASGATRYAFGERIAESGMRADGVFIDTQGSVPVKSIFRGRVLFADYLKGYGLLLIIDHGDDHISLYGHNESINKRVGDIVETGEIVSNTGVSGGLRSHGLYFEIRESASPVDPADWCQ